MTAPAPTIAKPALRAPQIRVLKALAKAGKPLSRKEIAEKAATDLAMLTEYIGSNDSVIRAKNDVNRWPSLLTIKLIKFAPAGDDNGVYYDLTAAGRKAAEKA
ncbi:MAG: hypothetical protein ACRC7O_06150 [Fimbriiglobus sp.]